MWIELHETLPGHKKIIEVSDTLGLPDTQVIGMMVCLWTWALRNRPDGMLSDHDWRVLERNALWTGEPRGFFDALVNAHFIDRLEEGFYLHDWMDYAGKLVQSREKDRQRKAAAKTGKESEFQRKSSGIPAEFQRSSEGIPDATVTLTGTLTRGTTTTATGVGAHEEEGETTPAPAEPSGPDPDQGSNKDGTPAAKCYGHYERNIGLLNMISINGLRSYLADGMEDALICAAIDECLAANVRNWKYLNTILNECMMDNVLTLEGFRKRQEEHQARASPQGRGGGKKLTGGKRDGSVPYGAPDDDLRRSYGI
jgi:DnaD/phage-associated family protein